MRLVCVADTHLYDEALGELPEGDVLIHAGDLLRSGRLVELEYAAQWLEAQPHRHKVVVAGNHDWCFVRARDSARARLEPFATYLEDAEVTIEGVRLWGSPWQPEFFGHIHEDGGLWRRGPTTIVNVTTWECMRGPTVLDYDPITRSVSALDVPPAEV